MRSEAVIRADFQRYLKAKAVTTYPAYVSSLDEFLTYLAERDVSYWQVTDAIAEEYRGCLLTKDKSLSRGTINNKLNRLRVFYRFLNRRHLTIDNPFAQVGGLKTGKTVPKNVLSVADMGKLLDNFAIKRPGDVMLKALVELLYGSALRISEAEALVLGDVDFTGGFIQVTNFKENGKKWRCPATEASLKTLQLYCGKVRRLLLSAEELQAGRLFPRDRGKTTLRCRLNGKLSCECRRLGLKRITSHGFRHSAATHLLRSGAGIREVQALLGHERITSTQHYTRVVKEDLKRVVEACHPRGGLNEG